MRRKSAHWSSWTVSKESSSANMVPPPAPHDVRAVWNCAYTHRSVVINSSSSRSPLSRSGVVGIVL